MNEPDENERPERPVPLLPGDLVVHLPEDERAAAVEYQRAGLPYYPSDEDGL